MHDKKDAQATRVAPPAGTNVSYLGFKLVSLGELCELGKLKTALPEEPGVYWGRIPDWRVE